MTRPMPGPPTCVTDGFPHERTARHACLIHARSYHANSKRLEDAECVREWGDAAWDEWYAAADHIRGDKRLAARFERPENSARTWARFATRPHALEEA